MDAPSVNAIPPKVYKAHTPRLVNCLLLPSGSHNNGEITKSLWILLSTSIVKKGQRWTGAGQRYRPFDTVPKYDGWRPWITLKANIQYSKRG